MFFLVLLSVFVPWWPSFRHEDGKTQRDTKLVLFIVTFPNLQINKRTPPYTDTVSDTFPSPYSKLFASTHQDFFFLSQKQKHNCLLFLPPIFLLILLIYPALLHPPAICQIHVLQTGYIKRTKRKMGGRNKRQLCFCFCDRKKKS